MAAFRTVIIVTSIILYKGLLGTASPAVANEFQNALDASCKTMAKAYNAANPDVFGWSNAQKLCVVQSGQNSSQPMIREESAAQGCSGGYLSCVGRECSQYDPSNYQDGESGAFAGCLISCAIRCSI
ncbi:hypothetical protein JR316_0009500 [Psilocybe cubensis]|uniref:Uncharacterized protein n=2 Tax=Psilocybe cubensis TaxID=181762 RepID=A0ACB8GPZ4_PSICU|nr:hypothetical protein JR316_0009500 [Psilocybe cubensis]KAH9477296.1 hypothetical protein JR316_0009500 [Psilocybe cubensis]